VQSFLDEVQDFTTWCGMEINEKKTFLLVIDKDRKRRESTPAPNLRINSEHLKTLDHCFWQASDFVCTTVLTVTLSSVTVNTVVHTKKKTAWTVSEKKTALCAVFFVVTVTVHNKLENDLETNNKQTNVIDLTMRTLVMHTHTHIHTNTDTHTHINTLCVCACLCVCICVCACVGGCEWAGVFVCVGGCM